MIIIEALKKEADFIDLKKGDIVACEWHRDSYKGKKKTRFATYEIVQNKESGKEIILQKAMNVYFNYGMYCTGGSNLKSIVKLSSVAG
jgi:hypothetical protein